MAELSIGDAVGTGFEIIRRKPLVVLSWGLIELLFAAATLALFGSVYVDIITQAWANAQNGTSTSPEALARVMQMQGASFLLSFGGGFVRIVVLCAVFRSVLHPEASRFAYLRVGAAEVFLFLLLFAAYIAFVMALIIPAIFFGIVIAALAMSHAGAAAAIVGVVAVIALLVAIFYVALRFSLVGPMMVDDGKFHLFDAWALTRRHVAGLFLVALILFAILIIGEIVVGLVLMLSGLGVLSSAAGGVTHIEAFFHQPVPVILGALAPFLVIMGIVWVPVTGCAFAIAGAPWAKAYRDLSGPDLAATFS
jgi:hypothetical protein